MRKIFYYISDHGRGHASRAVAIIRELEKLDIQVIIRNSNSTKFLKNSLHSSIISGITDVGPIINEDGISINVEKSIPVIENWIAHIDQNVLKEIQILEKHTPDLIISDTSVMPLIAAKNKKIPSILFSNFSWYDVLKFLPREKLELLKTFYDYANLAIQLPYGTNMNHFKNKKKVGLVSRVPTKTIEEIKNELNILSSNYLISVFLPTRHKLKLHGGRNFVFISMNSNLEVKNLIEMPENMESQNIVMASDLVIGKCGYGLLSECLSNGVPLLYISDKNHLEQVGMSAELEKISFVKKTNFKKIQNTSFDLSFIKKLSKSKKINLDNNKVVDYILKFNL